MTTLSSARRTTPSHPRLQTFIDAFGDMLDGAASEADVLSRGRPLLASLISTDDWLPDDCAMPDPQYYRQYLLHLDPAGRFSVVSFVWGPGQVTPIHDHTVWGLLGVLRGAERAQRYERVDDPASPTGQRYVAEGAAVTLKAGDIDAVSPTIGDIHKVGNAVAGEVSVSIHVYGGDVGTLTRSVFTEAGERKPFVSGYANAAASDGTEELRTTSPQTVRQALLARSEIALIDVREEDPFAAAHPLFAANFPLSRLELDVPSRIPRRTTRTVVYDNGEGLAERAAHRLIAFGYTDVSLLEGGLAGWRDAGFELFKDVNVPSKAFGELVESERHTPSLSADEVKALLDAKANVVVLDARPFEEYHTMNIPGGTSVPGAELALRARVMAPDPATTIIVNCAGRTRSIIGTQSLVNAGIPNKVAALRNGTIGWTLAGHRLETGQKRRFHDILARRAGEVDELAVDEVARTARRLAARAGVRLVSMAELEAMRADHKRTTYLFDVRTPEEYEEAHLPGARHAPGGQLVQEADVYAPVRGARVVLTDAGIEHTDGLPADTRGTRALMTASWLAQMNIEVYVLEEPGGALRGAAHSSVLGERGAWRGAVAGMPPTGDSTTFVTPDRLGAWLGLSAGAAAVDGGSAHDAEGAVTTVVIDVGRSARYVREHIPGAWFALRSELEAALTKIYTEAHGSPPQFPSTAPAPVRYVVTADEQDLALLAARDLAALKNAMPALANVEIHVLDGGLRAWRGRGLPVEAGDVRLASPRIDRYRRPYEGTDNPVEAMQGYLDWEFGLVEQLRRDGTHGFKVV